MPAVQSTYLNENAIAYEGMIVNTEPNNLISREVEGAAIGFGKAVKQGTADAGVALATASNDVFRGITVRTNDQDAEEYPVRASALVMTRGVIWVTAHDTVVAGAAVYVAVSASPAADAMKFTDAASGNLAVPNAIFESSGAADELVKIRLLG